MSNRDIPITGGDNDMDQQTNESPMQEPTGNGMEGDDERLLILERRVAELEEENETLRDQRLRAVADLDNARRRAQQDVLNTVQYANQDLLKKILPIVDDFQRSVEAGSESKDFDSFFTGVSMIRDKVLKILDEVGVKPIDAVGQEFDVEFHEALMRQPSDLPEGTVVSVLEPGYTYKDRVLRHAKVTVSAG